MNATMRPCSPGADNALIRAGYTGPIIGYVEKVVDRPPISFRQFAQQNAPAWR